MALRDEIYEQPDVLRKLLATQWPAVESLARAIRERDVAYVFLAGRGTSSHAGFYAQYLWGAHNRLAVAMASPSLFTRYQRPPDLSRALVIGISQSGQSPDIVAVATEGARQKALTLAITNDPNSPLAEAASHTLDISAGVERSVAATKTYTAQLMVLAMLSVALDDQDGAGRAALERVPGAVEAALAQEDQIARVASQLRDIERCVVIGRGYNFATTLEWALKLKELTYVAADPYSSAEFQHGPTALVEPGLPVLAVAPQDAVAPDVLALLEQLDKQQTQLLVLSNHEDALADYTLRLGDTLPDWLSPIEAIIPAQLFCMHLAFAKGHNPDTPRGLRKVTLTE